MVAQSLLLAILPYSLKHVLSINLKLRVTIDHLQQLRARDQERMRGMEREKDTQAQIIASLVDMVADL